MSANSFELNSKLNIYPNPTSGSLTVSFESTMDAKYSLKIVNVLGSVMIEETIIGHKGFNSKTINLEKEAKGLYFLTVENEGEQVKTLRIIIE